MTLQPFTNEQLNYFKFASIVINEFPKILRQAFKTRWDNTFGHLPGFQPWDDSVAVRKLFLATEGGSTKVPTNLPYDAWDCTALFQATIFAKSFSMPDGRGHQRTLSYLFVRPHGLPPGGFHASVISSTGNDAESFTLAIDQLRLLRNAFCHAPSSEIPKATFHMYIQLTKDAFHALGVSYISVNTIGSLTVVDFPIEKVRKLEDEIRKEGQAENAFLKDQVKNELMDMRSDNAEASQERRDEAQRIVTEMKEGFRQVKMQNEEQKEQILESVERAIRSHNAQSKRAREEETTHVAKKGKEDIQLLENQLQRHNEEMRKEALELKETIRSNIDQSNQAREKDAASAAQERKEEIQELRKQLELATSSVPQQEMGQKLAELNQKIDDIIIKTTKQEFKPTLPKSNLPSMVPHFTGREKECNDVIAHVTNEATRLVSIWGSPGFGKTSTAIAIGHRLQAQGLPVYFISLRGLRLKSDLTSRFLGLFTHSATASQRLTADDELCSILAQIANPFVFILDNADDLFESGLPNVKEEVVDLIGEILNCSHKVTFLLTTRESCQFLDLRFKGHYALRIRELDEQSSSKLVQELLPEASKSDCIKVRQICGSVPLAMKLLCSSISGDTTGTSSRSVDMFLNTTNNILEMLGNPDYPSSYRSKDLFEASFQRLSVKEREALVSLCILPNHFDLHVASAVLGMKTIQAARMLEKLKRKSLIDSSSKAKKYSIQKLLLSFIQEKGENEMKEMVLNAKVRFFELYISLFETLTEKFLTGRSLLAFLEFFQNEESFVQSLIDGCLEERTVSNVCNVLIKAEMYLCFLYWQDDGMFDIIYETAIKAASDHNWLNSVHQRLLLSKTHGSLAMGATAETERLLSVNKQVQLSATIQDTEFEGELLAYRGLYKLVIGRAEEGVTHLEEALSSMETTPKHRILKLIILQVLALYHCFKSNQLKSRDFYKRAVDGCKEVGDTGLVVIPEIDETSRGEVRIHLNETRLTHNQPLQTEVLILVSQAIKNISTDKTNQFFCNLMQQILTESDSAIPTGAAGRFNFHFSGARLLNKLKEDKDRVIHMENIVNFHPKRILKGIEKSICATSSKNSERIKANHVEALESEKRALNIRLKVLGEQHSQTAHSYHSLGVTQHSLGDFVSALESKRRALDIRLNVLGQEHSQTADSYHSLGVTQHSLGDFVSALESNKRALNIRLTGLGEEHSQTAHSYHLLGATQNSLGDFESALESNKHALNIRLKVLGEEHSETAHSYHSSGVSQHSLGNFVSALESNKRALNIRLKVLGEEHSQTADSYHSLGVTQHSLGDFVSALESDKRALNIRLKVLGEEHSQTADSYDSLGVTQHSVGDFESALKSNKRALDIRSKVLGEEHSQTADSYYSLGVSQNSLGDFVSALESNKRALDIRSKVLGEEHSQTAHSYHSLGVTQHSLGDFVSALESKRRALDIRLKVLGQEHSQTADSYHSLGVTQHSLGDFVSALESHKCALGIRMKVHGEEDPRTVNSLVTVKDLKKFL
ncbi:uncharacterized protein [Pocillopora verrucosa]|uniref:uncharacterized protein n=1 Tax=Pocillopora verrucosa TaxID=203993 RepID=UPI00334257BA